MLSGSRYGWYMGPCGGYQQRGTKAKPGTARYKRGARAWVCETAYDMKQSMHTYYWGRMCTKRNATVSLRRTARADEAHILFDLTSGPPTARGHAYPPCGDRTTSSHSDTISNSTARSEKTIPRARGLIEGIAIGRSRRLSIDSTLGHVRGRTRSRWHRV